MAQRTSSSRGTVAALLGGLVVLGPAAASAGPAFCEGFKARSSYSLRSGEERLEESAHGSKRHDDETLLYLQRLACAKPADEAAAMALRETWLKELGLTEADAADAQPLMPDVDRIPTTPAKIENRSLSSLTPTEQALFIEQQVQFADTSDRVPSAAWWLDSIPGGPSMVARLKYVELCLANLPSDSYLVQRAITWAQCAEDARALDRAAFDADLASAKTEGPARFAWHARLGRAQLKARAIETELTALGEKDPGFKQILADIPAAARTSWAATVKATPMITTALEIQDAALSGSRKAMAGCNDKLWPAWEASMHKARVDVGLDMGSKLMGEPELNALAYALVACNTGDATTDVFAQFLGDALSHAPGYRGERMAVLRALVENANKIQFDQKGTKLSPRDLPGFRAVGVEGVKSQSYKGAVRGVIAKLEPKGESVLVSFKSMKVKYESCDASKETDRIDRIENGRIIYREVCTKWSVQTATETPTPVLVPKLLAFGLAPGLEGFFMRAELGDGQPAMPLSLAKPKAKRGQLVALLGVGTK